MRGSGWHRSNTAPVFLLRMFFKGSSRQLARNLSTSTRRIPIVRNYELVREESYVLADEKTKQAEKEGERNGK